MLDNGADLTRGDGTVHIRLGPEEVRRIALLALPKMRIDFEFVSMDGPARDAFMSHFDLYFRRGGG